MNSLSSLNPYVAAGARELERLVRGAGGNVRFTSTLRSYGEQAQLYAGRAGNPYPVAVPGTSKHEQGLAFDAVITPASWQVLAGAWWESIGGRWGGRFHRYDPVHFEA